MDDFQTPKPHEAASKPTVSAVLTWLANSGETLLHLLAGLLAGVMILYSGYVLYDSSYTRNQAFASSWELLKYKPEIISDGAEPTSGGATLAEINKDYRAWITMYDTMIDYPVMQGENDYFYGNHDVYGEASLTGSIYMAAGNTRDLSDDYNLLYGHHMDNGAMFGALDKYRTRSFFDAHRDGVLVGASGVYDLRVFAVAETDAYEDEIYLVGPHRDPQHIIDFLRTGSATTNTLFFDEQAVQGAERVTALSTCADAVTNGRLVVFCVATRRNLLSLDLLSYDEIYDAQEHELIATPNYPDGTVIEYSTDGGLNWQTTPPALTNVGKLDVTVRATNDVYGTATATGVLRVRPKPVTVTAVNTGKIYGTPDPVFTYVVDGIIDGYELTCSVSRPGAGGDENVYTYQNAIVPTGDERQGNYVVTYVPADFTVYPAQMTVQVVSYEGAYDGETHVAAVQSNVTEGTTVKYRPVGGSDADWTETPPSITHVGSVDFEVLVTNPNYDPVHGTGTLTVTHRSVTVTANPAAKSYDTKDPAFSAVVSGTVGKDTIQYKIIRPKAGKEEKVGVYTDAIVPTGRELQGDYSVTYVPADFTIARSDVLTLNASDYEGLYDARSHKASATVNITDGTKIEYSTDGKTWSPTPPSITNVGTLRVYVRAVNPSYVTAQTAVTLKVNPRPVRVVANDAVKIYGTGDPDYTATVTGLVDDFTITYTVDRRGGGETVGTYSDALVPTGEQRQGNYTVTFVPADLTIAPAKMVLIADGWDGVFDAQSHKPVATVSIEDGTTIEYSTDGGETWTETPPAILNVGEKTVMIRATNPNYEPVTQTVTLRVAPRPVKVIADDTTKTSGEDDPEFTVTIEGLLGDDTLDFTVKRTVRSEKAGTYEEGLEVIGEELQGNYIVTYESATLTILPSKAERAPWSLFDIFKPNGSSDKVWALVNLLCLILTAYMLLPILHLKDKYGRVKQMQRYNKALEEDGDEYPDSEQFAFKVQRFLKRFRIGVVVEALLLIGSVIAFILTENLRNPMTLIDKYTPLMLLMLVASWLIDVRLARYRTDLEKEAEEQTDAAQES